MFPINKHVGNSFLSRLLEQEVLDFGPVINVVQVQQTVRQPLILEVGLHSTPEWAVGFGKHLTNKDDVIL